MNTIQMKKIILNSLAILLGVLLLISLAFPLNSAKFIDYYYTITYTDSGFTLFDFESNLLYIAEYASAVPVVGGIFAYLQFFLSLAIITLGVVNFFFDNEKLNKATFILLIVGVSFSAWYMLEGIVYSSIYKDNNGSKTSTTAWLSFLLCALTFVAYMLCKYLIADEIKNTANEKTTLRQPAINIKSTGNRLALLKQYKEMLDQGIITQEEFEIKKKELL